MRIIKLALISIVLLFAVVTALSLLLPSEIIISRAVDINAPVNRIQGKLASPSEWKTWLSNRDTLSINVAPGKLVMGNTTVYLVSANESQVKTDWQVKEGEKMRGTFNIITHPGTEVVTVQWQFIHRVKWYPWEKFASIISDKVVGPFMEQSLDNLKATIETTQ